LSDQILLLPLDLLDIITVTGSWFAPSLAKSMAAWFTDDTIGNVNYYFGSRVEEAIAEKKGKCARPDKGPET
jgi:hypothetical protein